MRVRQITSHDKETSLLTQECTLDGSKSTAANNDARGIELVCCGEELVTWVARRKVHVHLDGRVFLYGHNRSAGCKGLKRDLGEVEREIQRCEEDGSPGERSLHTLRESSRAWPSSLLAPFLHG
jgi:hypothetical protein